VAALWWVGPGLILLGLTIWAGNRTLRSAERAGGGAADAFGNFIDVFDPGRARADRDLKDQNNAGPVTRSPDDDEERDGIRLIRNPDGSPRAVRVRRGPR
jgi:hypothetical protein